MRLFQAAVLRVSLLPMLLCSTGCPHGSHAPRYFHEENILVQFEGISVSAALEGLLAGAGRSRSADLSQLPEGAGRVRLVGPEFSSAAPSRSLAELLDAIAEQLDAEWRVRGTVVEFRPRKP